MTTTPARRIGAPMRGDDGRLVWADAAQLGQAIECTRSLVLMLCLLQLSHYTVWYARGVGFIFPQPWALVTLRWAGILGFARTLWLAWRAAPGPEASQGGAQDV